VEDLGVGQKANGAIGGVVVRDMDPECGPAGASVAEVELDGLGVIGDGTGDALGEAALGLVGVLQDRDEEALRIETSGRSRAVGSWSDIPVGQATSFTLMALTPSAGWLLDDRG
jgi:hypothetical protein